MGRLLFLALTCLALIAGPVQAQETAQAGSAQVDLEIVFAVDASGSVDDEEFALQIGGIAAALRDPRVNAAMRSGPNQRIGAALLIWSDAAYPTYTTPWRILSSDASADTFAAEIEEMGARLTTQRRIGGGTGIGDAIVHALEMLRGNDLTALRQVIDVSGDGIETPPWSEPAPLLPQARGEANQQGVMVNGLAITHDFPNLVDYYQSNVITGPGSFVIRAQDFTDFKRAMTQKMWREFSLIFAWGGHPGRAYSAATSSARVR